MSHRHAQSLHPHAHLQHTTWFPRGRSKTHDPALRFRNRDIRVLAKWPTYVLVSTCHAAPYSSVDCEAIRVRWSDLHADMGIAVSDVVSFGRGTRFHLPCMRWSRLAAGTGTAKGCCHTELHASRRRSTESALSVSRIECLLRTVLRHGGHKGYIRAIWSHHRSHTVCGHRTLDIRNAPGHSCISILIHCPTTSGTHSLCQIIRTSAPCHYRRSWLLPDLVAPKRSRRLDRLQSLWVHDDRRVGRIVPVVGGQYACANCTSRPS